MDEIQDLFDKTLREQLGFRRLAARLISRKLEAVNVRLNTAEIDSLVSKLEKAGESGIITVSTSPWNIWDRCAVQVHITTEDLDQVLTEADCVLERLPEITQSITTDLATLLLPNLRSDWKRGRKKRLKGEQTLEGDIRALWGEVLETLGLEIQVADEIGFGVSESARNSPDARRAHHTTALLQLHARGCQVTREILLLCAGGFADGAMARWRTLHEISVVAAIIGDGDDELAEKYLTHSIVDSYKALEEYRRLEASPEEERGKTDEWVALEEGYENALLRYGNEFRSEYGWAVAICRKPRPTFRDLEQHVGLGEARPHYKWASHNVHPTSTGGQVRLGLPVEGYLLSTASPIGLDAPLANAGHSLSLLAIETTKGCPNLDRLVACKVISLLNKELTEVLAAMDVIREPPPTDN